MRSALYVRPGLEQLTHWGSGGTHCFAINAREMLYLVSSSSHKLQQMKLIMSVLKSDHRVQAEYATRIR